MAKVVHRLGEVLAETVKPRAGAGRPAKNGNTVLPNKNGLPKGITKIESSRAQALARIPWQEIKKRIDAKTDGTSSLERRMIGDRAGCSNTPPGLTQRT